MSLDSGAQNRDLDQIGTALCRMEQATQQIAANAEESAAASKQLNAQADSLHVIVTSASYQRWSPERPAVATLAPR
jgi:methyl-accepting chemotaxis protein